LAFQQNKVSLNTGWQMIKFILFKYITNERKNFTIGFIYTLIYFNTVTLKSSFLLNASKFGLSVHQPCWLKLSSLLTEDEALSLVQMTESSNGVLVYKATDDGFNATKFHKSCNYKSNTVKITKTNSNYTFGGYTAESWSGER